MSKRVDCYICGKENLSRNEIGLNQKLIGQDIKKFHCLCCLAEYLEVTEEELLAKVEEFKEQGCKLF
jgi:biotin operon repressor